MAEPSPLYIAIAGLGAKVIVEFERQVEQDDLRQSTACAAHIDVPAGSFGSDAGVRLTVTVSLQVSRMPAPDPDGGLATAQIAGSA